MELLSNKQQLLSLLHTFSIAAKHLSFTHAATELFLTQGGVSHRIKKLELQLGFSLFIRKTRKLELTPEGERVLAMLNTSFESIFSELMDIQTGELSGELYIATSHYFASDWLIPRLGSFRTLYPNLSIKLQTKQTQSDFQFEPYDVAIFYSEGHYANHYSERLFEGGRTPVCTRDYANKFDLQADPENLVNAQIIHSGDASAWQYWLDEMDLGIDASKRCDHYSDNKIAVDAARYSLGVALGRLEFVQPMIDSGELIAPFEMVPSGKGYDLVCPKGMETRTKFKVLSDWAKQQLLGN
ncbi:LysR family transcriptional regulator [Vibrio sp. ZSDE26]|uniref:LysR family transcriptional regulator n=1 Tax=Vibrio amylolyticus TaxID=2847292 RepID=A0A9X1XMN1_9VIBR|nr:LysR substrate-binding domain-containing protein [Vibrio amylolyticus]MCK6264403.1 LysR family transcriptional regulator [Vibrio amylolyticus]